MRGVAKVLAVAAAIFTIGLQHSARAASVGTPMALRGYSIHQARCTDTADGVHDVLPQIHGGVQNRAAWCSEADG